MVASASFVDQGAGGGGGGPSCFPKVGGGPKGLGFEGLEAKSVEAECKTSTNHYKYLLQKNPTRLPT